MELARNNRYGGFVPVVQQFAPPAAVGAGAAMGYAAADAALGELQRAARRAGSRLYREAEDAIGRGSDYVTTSFKQARRLFSAGRRKPRQTVDDNLSQTTRSGFVDPRQFRVRPKQWRSHQPVSYYGVRNKKLMRRAKFLLKTPKIWGAVQQLTRPKPGPYRQYTRAGRRY